EAVPLAELNPRLAAPAVVEQAQLHPVSNLREQGEISTRSVPGGTQRISTSRPDAHPLSLTRNATAGAGGHGRPAVAAGSRPAHIASLCLGNTSLRVAMIAWSTGSPGSQPDSNGTKLAGAPSVICSGAARPVRRAT